MGAVSWLTSLAGRWGDRSTLTSPKTLSLTRTSPTMTTFESHHLIGGQDNQDGGPQSAGSKWGMDCAPQ